MDDFPAQLRGQLRGPAQIDAALRRLGELLEHRGERFEIVVIGGSALILLGYIERATRDVDLVALVEAGELRSPDPLPWVSRMLPGRWGTTQDCPKTG